MTFGMNLSLVNAKLRMICVRLHLFNLHWLIKMMTVFGLLNYLLKTTVGATKMYPVKE